MTKNIFFILTIALAGCSAKEFSQNENADFQFSYQLDTVMVDAGDHFFFLNWGLGLSDVSPDRKYLYNLNPDSYLLEIVDLDNLKLQKTVQLEKEGPNGIGNDYYQKIQILKNGNICLFGQLKVNIVTEATKLVKTIEFDQIKLEANERIGNKSV
tara:strand:+ start:2106 stop:2570 length:465 start_codon:yes stop_codon:yes gene_type:complete